MSGNRCPNRSSLGPISGLVPNMLMWSSITISAPAENDVSMPPAALVSSTRFTPSRPSTRIANVTVCMSCPS